jgi:hypothetical protein
VAEAVKNGAEIADAVEAEKTLVESIRTDFEKNDDDSTIRESATDKFDYHVGGWA